MYLCIYVITKYTLSAVLTILELLTPCTLTFILLLPSVVHPFKIRTYERTVSGALQPFKCSLHLCRGLELYPHSLSPRKIMVCGQIHAPATLPNYVHMRLLNSCFATCLWSSKPHVCYYANATEFYHWSRFVSSATQFNSSRNKASFALPSIAVTGTSKRQHALWLNFLAVYPAAVILWWIYCSLFLSCSPNRDALHVNICRIYYY